MHNPQAFAPRRKGSAKRTVMAAGAVLGGLAAATVLVTAGQMVVAKRSIPVPQGPPPRGEMAYGPRSRGKAFTMVMLGDSFAAGYGAERSRETAGALLAAGLARHLRRRVVLRTLAVVGSETPDLRRQIDEAVTLAPDIAVIFIGGNDVTQLSPHRALVRELSDAVRRLRLAGCDVVVGTCPDLSVLPAFQPPLRWLAWFLSHRLALWQTIAATGAGGWTVPLGRLLTPAFRAEPGRMFSHDRFHPSADGYAVTAAVTLPTLLAVARRRGVPAAGEPVPRRRAAPADPHHSPAPPQIRVIPTSARVPV